MTTTGDLRVIGGAAGMAVEYAALRTAGGTLQSVAGDLLGVAQSAQRALLDPSLLASAALDPFGFGRVEAAVTAAVIGPHGLLLAAARLERRALSLAGAIARYELADRLQDDLPLARHGLLGTAGVAAFPVGCALASSPIGWAAAKVWVSRRRPAADLDQLLAEHPGIVDELVGAAPSFLTTLTVALGPLAAPVQGAFLLRTGHSLRTGSIEETAGSLGRLYPMGSPLVLARGEDHGPVATTPPRGVADLLAALDHRDDRATGPAQGEIDVRRISWTSAGRVVTSWVVNLPGTKAWQLDPRRRNHLNDLATNLATLAGARAARVDGVTKALRLAGVPPTDPVMLVGHSQGGLVALRAAEQYAADGQFRVTHVVTAGAPVSHLPVPRSVSLLSLENRFDVVPRLDGRPPPDQPNRITVVFDRQHHAIGRNHAIADSYLPAGRLLDAADEASLQAWREGARVFLPPADAPAQVRATVWDIRNDLRGAA